MAAAKNARGVGPAGKRPPPVVVTDPRAIKALAHPARLAVLDELLAGRKLTATECAAIAGLSPSAMSYHLRAMERWGVIERAEASGDGRERPWQAVAGGWRLESADPRESATAEASLVARLLDRQRADVLAALTEQSDSWRDITTIASSFRWLTADQAAQLAARLGEVLDSYPKEPDDAAEGSRRIRIGYVVAPTDED